jgi:hypothetical protein
VSEYPFGLESGGLSFLLPDSGRVVSGDNSSRHQIDGIPPMIGKQSTQVKIGLIQIQLQFVSE